ncbi:MAG: pyridoxamine 5'-phosphate oxidase family protein [Actinomycetota bacterium]|jgi:uncharacterized protein|nr:pyridoxamine 5'-phosphate oxidase family protein [Actinomycetota bacterium]
MVEIRHQVRTHEELRALYPTPRLAQRTKVMAALDEHCRRWITASPFIVICSADAEGRMDVSPKGDPAGFVSVLDDRTLAIPDRRGNHRVDTFSNIVENPRAAVIFLVPGREETVRVAGGASLATDPELLQTMAIDGKPPTLALIIHVEEAMFHCGKSMIRSKMWQQDHWPDVDGLASYAECLADQATSDETVEQMESRFGTWHHGNELY